MTAEIATAAATIAAVVVALIAWKTSDNTLRMSYRPIVRPVPLKAPGHPLGLHPRHLLLKNYGRGPAFSVLLYRDDAFYGDHPPMAERDVVEPLGSGPSESTRIGRAEMPFHATAPDFETDRRYRLIYQDFAGNIHETQFEVQRQAFVVRFLPPRALFRQYEAIPRNAHDRFQVVTFEPPDA